ncbi:unnamed protein product [Rotaria sordida]|uniref:Uncharacterized protein n=1 Tax=Rotaria sordida TaxID=392033 RepID=A0A818HDH9_9BILA|nr:unnamed protein product [Rotaria sordida]CAF0997810.1 unnamed protein product [Rotaria sordida]CAF1035038.1 unnamed protein product [Rotaria sordida]CAF1286836.1 unnamed protein product [Rotaria sordida]CAF3506872.1 unnamed protein product [Rotaria sordida]
MDEFENEMSHNPRIIQAHKSELAAITLSSTSNLLATASKRGTLIRIFLTTGLCEKIFEFQRGSDTADIYSLAFNCNSDFLCVSSDTGTVHVYSVRDPKLNRKATFQYALNEIYGDLCNFSVNNEQPCICAFSDLQRVVVVSFNGTFYQHILTSNGKCSREVYEIYLDENDGCNF